MAKAERKAVYRTFQVASQLQVERPSSPAAEVLLPILTWVEERRERISEKIRTTDPLGVCRHLLLSEHSPDDPGGVLRSLGFVHVLTATGIHLLMLASLWDWVLIRLRTPKWFRGTIIVASATYVWLLAGARLGMLMPAGILAFRWLARARGWKLSRWTPLLAMLGVFSILGRVSTADAALGYALAVGGGMLGLGLRELPTHLGLALGSWAGVTVSEVLTTGMLSVATPLLSLVTLPWFTTVTLPGLALSSLPGLEGLGPGLALNTTRLLGWFVGVSLRVPSIWLIPKSAFYGGAALAATSFIIRRKRVAIVALLICAATTRGLAKPELPAPLAQNVEQLDVGQGDAALVWGAGGEIGLVDTGSVHGLTDAGWLELLASRGITQILWVLLTHLDEDHSGGLLRLARLLPIHCAVTSSAERHSPRGEVYAEKLLREGLQLDTIETPCVPFSTLGPPAHAGNASKASKANANMTAIAVPLQGGGLYLSMGDADQKDESRFAEWYARRGFLQDTGPRILKISHHGSETSSGFELLKKIDPDLAWISAGTGNHFNHPRARIVIRLHDLKIPLERTDQQGSLDATTALREATFPHRPQIRRP